MSFNLRSNSRELVPASRGSKHFSNRGSKFALIAGSVLLSMVVSSCSTTANELEAGQSTSPSTASATPSLAPTAAAPTPTPTPEPAPEPEPTPEPESVLPEAQSGMINTVGAAADAFQAATTDLKRSNVIVNRDNDICAITGGVFTSWAGTITKIGANNDGHAFVTVKIDGDIELATWNNAFSDTVDGTLIQSGTPLWQSLSEMDEKTRVTVDGSFVADNNTCAKVSNMTEAFNAASPDFVVRFSDVRPG